MNGVIVFVLIVAVAYLWLQLNKRVVKEWISRRNKSFTIFRAYYLDGRYGDYIALDDADVFRIRKEMDMHIATKTPYSMAGPITRYEEIAAKDYDETPIDPTPPKPVFDWRDHV